MTKYVMIDIFNPGFQNSHLSRQNDTLYFWNTLHTYSKYTNVNSLMSHQIRISSIIVLLPNTSGLPPIVTTWECEMTIGSEL